MSRVAVVDATKVDSVVLLRCRDGNVPSTAGLLWCVFGVLVDSKAYLVHSVEQVVPVALLVEHLRIVQQAQLQGKHGKV